MINSPLPAMESIPSRYLAACFSNTAATYKFYWLLAILDAVQDRTYQIEKKQLFARMISNAWYTVNYFHISFGPNDKLAKRIKEIKQLENIDIDESKSDVFQKIYQSQHPQTVRLLHELDAQVPHWFLSPWFPKSKRAEIYAQSQNNDHQSLYRLYKNHIEIHEEWIPYLTRHIKIIRDYIYWNLALFLQVRNPNVPDIPNKLIKPAVRNSLIKQRKFWDFVIDVNGPLTCIYTGRSLTVGDFHVEHFIPYSFVSHDQIWNLIPADHSFNMSKSNRIPPLEYYFDSFYKLQELALDTYIHHGKQHEKLLEDYFYIGTDLHKGLSKDKFYDVINPLVTIASNNGFEFMKLSS